MTTFNENSCLVFQKYQKTEIILWVWLMTSWMLIMKKTVGSNQDFFCLYPKLTIYRRQKRLDVNWKKMLVVPDDFFKFSIQDGVKDNELNILRNPCIGQKNHPIAATNRPVPWTAQHTQLTANLFCWTLHKIQAVLRLHGSLTTRFSK